MAARCSHSQIKDQSRLGRRVRLEFVVRVAGIPATRQSLLCSLKEISEWTRYQQLSGPTVLAECRPLSRAARVAVRSRRGAARPEHRAYPWADLLSPVLSAGASHSHQHSALELRGRAQPETK
ncbi:hypothetical protein MHYP_G00228650 [Metynnis hypsauchen]